MVTILPPAPTPMHECLVAEAQHLSIDLSRKHRWKKPPAILRAGSSDISLATASSHSDYSSDLSTSASNSGRRVRFLTDKNDRIVKDVYSYEAIPSRMAGKCYLTHGQISLKKRAARAYCNLYSRIHPEYLASVHSLFGSPASAFGKDQGRIVDQAEALTVLAMSDARGLERHMTDIILRHQRRAIRSVVECYTELRDGGLYSTNEVDEILRQQSLKFSQCTTDFALLLAQGDENEADCVYAGGYEI